MKGKFPVLQTHNLNSHLLALRDYEVRALKYGDQLVEGLTSLSRQPVNASNWFLYYGFDVMGDLAFGESFDMLKSGEMHKAIQLLHDGMLPLGVLSPVVWMIPMLAGFPYFLKPALAKGFDIFVAWCAEQVDKRRTRKPQIPDITSWLLDDLKTSPNQEEALKWLRGDARLIVVAGADTTAVALTHIFYHLAADPTHVDKLREEIQEIWKEGTKFNVWDFQNAEYLNGVINEGLRLHPPVPSGVQRITPPEGVTVDGVFIPGGVNIAVSSWAIGRCEFSLAPSPKYLLAPCPYLIPSCSLLPAPCSLHSTPPSLPLHPQPTPSRRLSPPSTNPLQHPPATSPPTSSSPPAGPPTPISSPTAPLSHPSPSVLLAASAAISPSWNCER